MKKSMNIYKSITVASTLLVALLQMQAQEPLTQEITVDHEVVPERRDIARLNYKPVSNLPAVKSVPLSYSNRSVQLAVPGIITTLQPAAFADTLATWPYRGYVAGGYFPLYNLGLTAGYKIVDNDRTRLAAFMQYDGSLYKGHFGSYSTPSEYVRRHTGLFDITLHQAVGKKSFIDAGVELELARYNLPGENMLPVAQGMHRVGADITWISTARGIDYEVGVKYGNFGFNNTIFNHIPELFAPVKENSFGIEGKGRYKLTDTSSVGLEASFNLLANSRNTAVSYSPLLYQYRFVECGSYSHALLRLYPYYRFEIKKFRLDLGANIDFTFNSGKAIHIAPRALASWKPIKLLTIFAKAGGGEHQNSLKSLYGAVPYAQTFMTYGNSHLPITFDAGITAGTISGFYAKAQAGYARANNWLMPVTINNGMTIFKPIDISGLQWLAEAGYTHKWGTLAVSYQGAPQGYKKGYYMWRDRAKGQLEASLKVTPIKPLDVKLSYAWRHGRAMIDREPDSELGTGGFNHTFNLGDVKNLTLGGAYRYTDRLTFFATFDNILNKRQMQIGLIEAQGFNGLLGATYKF